MKGADTTACRWRSDADGNTFQFTESGVTTSNGNSKINFLRDTAGRITAAIEPAGNRVQYGYDSRGDLVRVTDRDGHTTRFAYESTPAHYLQQVTDTLGRQGIRAEYGVVKILHSRCNESSLVVTCSMRESKSSRPQYDFS